jgi:hypothetical protein
VRGPGQPFGFQDHENIRGVYVQDTVSEWPVAANIVPWRLSPSVIGSVGLAGRRVRAKRRLGMPTDRIGIRGLGGAECLLLHVPNRPSSSI